MTCNQTQSRLGEWLDGELPAADAASVEAHLRRCPSCRSESEALRALAAQIAIPPAGAVPAEQVWQAIERRLDAAQRQRRRVIRAPLRAIRRFWRPIASAAAVVIALGLGWLAVNGPRTPAATAAQIDFRPLLEQAGENIGAGIQALLRAHGGEAIRLEDAHLRLRVRIHPPAAMPLGLRLEGTYLLHMGPRHRSLALHFRGPRGDLLVLQCPPGVQREYGDRECLACSVDGREGGVVRAGPLRLMHFESPAVCICIVSTLDEQQELPAALAAIRMEF